MRTIRLNVHDDIYKHIMFLFKSLDRKKLEIVEDKEILEKDKQIDFSKYKIDTLKDIEDPVQWQQDIRNEWKS